MRTRSRASLVAAMAALAACGGKSPAPASPAPAPASATAAATAEPAHEITPSRLFPELVGERGIVATESGETRVLVDRMRLVVHADGSMDRAPELLPQGNVYSIALPSRLGGGYLFHANGGGGTEIWRAAGWLGKLRPLARRGEVVADVVPGFDRIYMRLTSGNRVVAMNVETGDAMPLGPLPVASSYGMLAFADGWRAVVDTDLRGPLATFDAGGTWRPVGVTEKPQAVGVIDGSLAVMVQGGRYLVDARGSVTHRTDDAHGSAASASPAGAPGEVASTEARRPGPLGKRPLRAAVEDGWPDSSVSAIVARGGAIGRVSLQDGAVLELVEDAYPERRSTCHAVRLGVRGAGFVCGERDGPTTVYELATPLGMKPLLRFDRPRFVAASGNGALVIRGRCAEEAPEGVAPGSPAAVRTGEADARWYCVRSPAGKMREVRIKGFDLGVERVVGLADGRVAVLVPPRGGSPGMISIIAGATPTNVPLVLPAEPKSAARELRHGMWLEGFEERSPGVLGGWVEAGGPAVGVEVALDGKVKAGEVREDAIGETGGVIFGGRFAVSVIDGGRAAETTDGGMTWSAFDLPPRDDEARAVPSRAVGPVGAALPGWIRVGWGEPGAPDDMKPAEKPGAPFVPLKISPTIGLRCELTAVASPPPGAPGEKPRVAPPPPPPLPRGILARRGAPYRPPPVERGSGWLPLRNVPPPPLAADETGLDNGAAYDTVQLRAYAWGKRGTDWTRTGRWLVRFDDRFDAAAGVRSSALTASPWPDEATAREGMGSAGASYGNASWSALLDPSGRAALVAACHSASSCALYAVGEGQPVLPVHDAAGRPAGFLRPYGGGAVRVGDTWYFLSQSASYDAVALYRVDLGVARQIGGYFRPVQRYGGVEAPRLVRRAQGGGVGVLASGPPEPGERSGSWYVLPADLETGELGEAILLARRDLAGPPLARCAPEQDGWVLDMTPDTSTPVEVLNAGAPQLDTVEMRVRMDPGAVCIERMATRGGGFTGPTRKPLTAPPGRKGVVDDATAIPLAVTEKATGRRWGLACAVIGKK